MSVIIPRWEWRMFGPTPKAAAAGFAALESDRIQESDEVYLLSPDPTADTVKVRDDLMDIKTLREVDSDGLERWEPVLKARFPLSAEDARSTIAALRVEAALTGEAELPLDAFLAIVVPHGIRPVSVHKRRVRYVVGGCTSELTDVTVDGRAARTIAVESPDKVAVLAAVQSLGLAAYRNTSYPRGLAAAIDGRPLRVAVIDVGTNSVKFHVAERPDGGAWRRVVDRAEVTRLGENLHADGEFDPAAVARTLAAIEGMADEARALGVSAIAAVGTAGLRAARDSRSAIEAIHTKTGVRIEVISGEEEGRLAYLATTSALAETTGDLVVFDTGGGSSQFTFGRPGEVERQFSVPVGAVRFTEQFGLDGAVSREVVEAARAAIATEFTALDDAPRDAALIGMGGAVTNLAAVKHALATYDPDVVSGTVLDRAELDRQIDLYRSMDAAGRRSIVGLQAGRAEVILAGACIVSVVMDKLGRESLTVSDRGLRHGLLLERFG